LKGSPARGEHEAHRFQSGKTAALEEKPTGQKGAHGFDAAPECMTPVLLDACAAALDQDSQNDDNQYACNNSDNRGSVHTPPSFND